MGSQGIASQNHHSRTKGRLVFLLNGECKAGTAENHRENGERRKTETSAVPVPSSVNWQPASFVATRTRHVSVRSSHQCVQQTIVTLILTKFDPTLEHTEGQQEYERRCRARKLHGFVTSEGFISEWGSTSLSPSPDRLVAQRDVEVNWKLELERGRGQCVVIFITLIRPAFYLYLSFRRSEFGFVGLAYLLGSIINPLREIYNSQMRMVSECSP
jgi:hypothetical protein